MEAQKESPTDSAEYAIRYGGVWLEFHERVAFAEEQLKLANEELAAARKQRDDLILAKASLEDKFKNSIASLTHTESNHLEARQIIEQVREEHKDLNRRCLAAEAHTEWLEDQLRQQKAVRVLKDEEISALQFRIDNLKSTLSESDSSNDSLKLMVAAKDREIEQLKGILKSRDEELVVMGRSNHSKDKQLAQVVRERNTLKEDLEATQRSLALARRTSGVSTRRAEVEKQKTENTTKENAFLVAGEPNATQKQREEAPALDIAATNAPTSTVMTANTNTAGNSTVAVLRKYKQSRMHTRRAASLCGAAAVLDAEITGGMMLDDILESVLASEAPLSVATTAHMANAVSAEEHDEATAAESADLAAQLSALPMTSFNTPVATRKCKAAAPAQQANIAECTQNVNITASLLLDDSDLNFIDDILDSVTPGGFSPRAPAHHSTAATSPKRVSKRLASSSLTVGTFDATVHKMLFGGDSPAPVKSVNPWGGAVVTPAKTLDGPSTSNASAAEVQETPLTAMGRAPTPGSSDTVGSALTDNAFPSSPQDQDTTPVDSRIAAGSHVHISKTNCSASTPNNGAQSLDITPYVEREQNYKSALYLLQEEVRMLRAQVAAHDAAKRTIRSTPKKAGTSASSTAATSSSASLGSSIHGLQGNGGRKSVTGAAAVHSKHQSMSRGHDVRPAGKVLFGDF